MTSCNISSFIADDDLSCGELLIDLSGLQHLFINSEASLENNRMTLDGTDRVEVGNPTVEHVRRVGQLMVGTTHEYIETQHARNETVFQIPVFWMPVSMISMIKFTWLSNKCYKMRSTLE